MGRVKSATRAARPAGAADLNQTAIGHDAACASCLFEKAQRMGNWWLSITEGQGTVISGVLTITAAVFGVILGGLVFGGKVKNLETALEATEKAIDGHLQRVLQRLTSYEEKFASLEAKLTTLEEQFSATSESLGQLRGSVGDLQSSASPEHNEAEEQGIEFSREKIRDDWNAIRDLLENKAADPNIDGRTRAKYARIDRRSYNDLIDALEWDENLDDAARYRQAVEIWHQYRNGRRAIDQAQASRLNQLRADLGA